ncbi:unnamed protein product [Angiostrongylus costaricensis]|uniref:KID domain-containing protein n=1 Tax=Angiostrongylus costaricensis TaxID=334426 RepID=A0A0R3PG69_ANGCS|nr:unnamed protein product [Angiostrongylus costaricensis]
MPPEIRTIGADDRARLLVECKRQRRAMRPERFIDAIFNNELRDIVNGALSPSRMPYWDASWDLRLPQPADSVLFSKNFFMNAIPRRRRRRRVGEKKMRET